MTMMACLLGNEYGTDLFLLRSLMTVFVFSLGGLSLTGSSISIRAWCSWEGRRRS